LGPIFLAATLAAAPTITESSTPPSTGMSTQQADIAVMDYYPAAARIAGIEGWAKVKCLPPEYSSCSVVSESPAGSGFGQAALALMTHWDSKRRPHTRPTAPTQLKPPAITYRFSFSLKPPLILPNPLRPVMVITNPDWARKPDGALMVWPAAAYRAHVNGSVVLQCIVTEEGRLKPCAVVQENPSGWGFGDAALSFAATFSMRPQMIDGQPASGARMQVPIDFRPPP